MPRHKKGSNVSTCHASRVLLPSWSEQVSFLVTPTWGIPGRTLDIALRHFLSRLCWTHLCVLALLPSCPSDHSSLLHYWLLYQLHHFLDWVKVYGLLIGRWSQTSAFLHTRDPLTGNDPGWWPGSQSCRYHVGIYREPPYTLSNYLCTQEEGRACL